MIVSWPARIKDKGGLRSQFLHVIDIVPTLYEVIGITPPTELNGVTAEADRRHQLRLHVRRRQGQGPAHHAVLRVGDQSGHLPRRLDGVGHLVPALGTEPAQDFDPDKQKWELYNLYLREGKPTFVYNYLALERTTVAATAPLPKGKVQLKVDFAYQGGPKELGKAAVVTMTVNGTKVAEGQVPKTIPATIGIGEDVGSPVDFTYKPPFRFTGKIEKVTYELK